MPGLIESQKRRNVAQGRIFTSGVCPVPRPALLDRLPQYVSAWNRARKWGPFRRRFGLTPETTVVHYAGATMPFKDGGVRCRVVERGRRARRDLRGPDSLLARSRSSWPGALRDDAQPGGRRRRRRRRRRAPLCPRCVALTRCPRRSPARAAIRRPSPPWDRHPERSGGGGGRCSAGAEPLADLVRGASGHSREAGPVLLASWLAEVPEGHADRCDGHAVGCSYR